MNAREKDFQILPLVFSFSIYDNKELQLTEHHKLM